MVGHRRLRRRLRDAVWKRFSRSAFFQRAVGPGGSSGRFGRIGQDRTGAAVEIRLEEANRGLLARLSGIDGSLGFARRPCRARILVVRDGVPPTLEELHNRFPTVNVAKLLPPGQALLGTVALGDAKIETHRSVSDESQSPRDGTIVYDSQRSKSSGGTVAGGSGSSPPTSHAAPAASGSTPAPRNRLQPRSHRPPDRLDRPLRDSPGTRAGSFGVVLRCTDDDLKRDVAIKLPHKSGASSAERVKEFLHEAQSAARLRHPGIVTVLNTGLTDDGRVYIVYEFIRGTTLQSRLEAGDYTLEDVVRWVAGAPKHCTMPTRMPSSTATSNRPTSFWTRTASRISPISGWRRWTTISSRTTPAACSAPPPT